MRTMGLAAIYRRLRNSKPASGHKVSPYLLGGLEITRPNQVRAADITCIPMAKGFLYLVAIMNWHSWYVVAWDLSKPWMLISASRVLEEALGGGRPEMFDTDQGGSSPERGLHRALGAGGSPGQHGGERSRQR